VARSARYCRADASGPGHDRLRGRISLDRGHAAARPGRFHQAGPGGAWGPGRRQGVHPRHPRAAPQGGQGQTKPDRFGPCLRSRFRPCLPDSALRGICLSGQS